MLSRQDKDKFCTLVICNGSQESSVGEANVARLVDHLSASIAESVFDTPNRISEDLVRCMAAIYCNLADYPPPRKGHSVSPTSSLSSTSTFSPRDRSEFCSPQSKTTGENDVRLKDPFQVKGSRESIGPYGQMVEATWICVDNHGLSYAARMLRNFRSLVRKLEKVDPRKMKYEEKLAFWVNVYNVIMMHVRVYTAKNIYQELEVAKEEYIRASIGIRKGNKVLLPKVLEGFARDTSLSSSKLLDMICQCLPEPQRNDIRRCSQTKAHKSIEWVPYNFSFRYIFSRALAKWLPPAIK